jgi:2-dehydro-3-deoxy-D-arabinonate dehydratase
MQLARFTSSERPTPQVGLIEGLSIRPLPSVGRLSDILHSADPRQTVATALVSGAPTVALASIQLLSPLDSQEVWGAGVTYERSKVARQEESASGGSFYDLVYSADRPELFFKATPSRVVGPGQPIRARQDTKWCVPEPELALVLAPDLRLVGFTVGDDVSARDIEGRNPLYLPQAKVYDACCALGPYVTLTDAMPAEKEIGIQLRIVRAGDTAFEGQTSTARLARRFQELIDWLGRDNVFPDGAFLLTGTGIVPPDEFSLQSGDLVHITIEGIGTLTNPVVQGPKTY